MQSLPDPKATTAVSDCRRAQHLAMQRARVLLKQQEALGCFDPPPPQKKKAGKPLTALTLQPIYCPAWDNGAWWCGFIACCVQFSWGLALGSGQGLQTSQTSPPVQEQPKASCCQRVLQRLLQPMGVWKCWRSTARQRFPCFMGCCQVRP